MAQKKSSGAAIASGIGLAAIAAAAAGAYYFYGKDGAKRKKALKSWALKAKAETMEKLEGLQHVSEKTYGDAVKQVMARYKTMKQVDPVELAALGKELHGYWKQIRSTVEQASAAAQKSAKRVIRKPVKKSKKARR